MNTTKLKALLRQDLDDLSSGRLQTSDYAKTINQAKQKVRVAKKQERSSRAFHKKSPVPA
jgi:hypothetical protein